MEANTPMTGKDMRPMRIAMAIVSVLGPETPDKATQLITTLEECTDAAIDWSLVMQMIDEIMKNGSFPGGPGVQATEKKPSLDEMKEHTIVEFNAES